MQLIVRVTTVAAAFFAAASFAQQEPPDGNVDLDVLIKENTAAAQQLSVTLKDLSRSLSRHARQKQLANDVAAAESNTNVYIALTLVKEHLGEERLQQAFAYLGTIHSDLNDATAIVREHRPYSTDPILGAALNQAMLALDGVDFAAQNLLRFALPEVRMDSCGFSDPVEIDRVPVEAGGVAAIFPDDFPAGATVDSELRRTPPGGTLYIRAGDYSVARVNYGRIHVRGEGATRTRLHGAMIFDGGASLGDVAVVNEGVWAEFHTLAVDGTPPAGAASFSMTRTLVSGGFVGLSVGFGLPRPGIDDHPVGINCARLGNFASNGIMLGNDFVGTRASRSHFRNVGVSGVGALGIVIRGDDVVLEHLSLSEMPFAAVRVDGDRTRITGGFLSRNQIDVSISGQATAIEDSYFMESRVDAVRVEGDGTRIERNRLLSPASSGVSFSGHEVDVRNNTLIGPGARAIVGILIQAPSTGYHVTGNAISHFRVGIGGAGTGGQASGNTFFDVEFPELP